MQMELSIVLMYYFPKFSLRYAKYRVYNGRSMNDVPELLERLREKGWNDPQLAVALGKHVTTVWRWRLRKVPCESQKLVCEALERLLLEDGPLPQEETRGRRPLIPGHPQRPRPSRSKRKLRQQSTAPAWRGEA